LFERVWAAVLELRDGAFPALSRFEVVPAGDPLRVGKLDQVRVAQAVA
jgi:hypothetical protein